MIGDDLVRFVVAVAVISALIGAAIATSITTFRVEASFRSDAVKHDAAIWLVDEAGKTTFIWRDELNKPEAQ